MAAEACPRTRCTTFGSAPAPSHSEAQVCRRSCTRNVGRPIAAVARDHPTERFRVLNGLGDKDRLKPGDLVKIVVE